MYLKSIEIQGFKSFAKRMNLEFGPGITCIVGPNGSGKSNVADAVRWVLGEQSAKLLRGVNMQDVIFSGSDSRRAQGYASVAITFDNADRSLNLEFPEVTVSRFVYRSGESEYRINGTICRRKDVQELFYDTGIGKEGYSVIGQGQIDQILSSKPEDRRELFDEAAGIVKFKRRKEETLKKLESERRNLERVTDILAELERQRKPLRQQAEKAKQYLRLYEQLKQCEAAIYVLEQEAGEKQLLALAEKLSLVQADLAQEKEAGQQILVQYEEAAARENRFAQEYHDMQDAYHQMAQQKTEMENRAAVLQERIRSLEKEQSRQQTQQEQSEQMLLCAQEQRTEAKKKREQTKRQLVCDLKYCEDLRYQKEQSEAKIEQFGEEIEREKESIFSNFHQKAEIRAKLQRLEAVLEQQKMQREDISRRCRERSEERERLQKTENDSQKDRQQMEAQRTALCQSAKQLSAKQQELSGACADWNARLARLEQQLHLSETKAEMMQNLAERYEGYGAAIRKVMEQKGQCPGIYGVVADLIQVEKPYETAIETALGGRIQNIVIDTEKTAQTMIDALKKNRWGRATFLPLDAVQREEGQSAVLLRQEILEENGILGTADQLVNADSRYQGVVRQLLGRIVVADCLTNALKAARKYRYTLRIVTLDGELLQAGGAITGGAYRNSANLLGRRREIEELRRLAAEQKRERERMFQLLDKKKRACAALEKQISEGQDAIRELSAEIAEAARRSEERKAHMCDLTEKNRAEQELQNRLEQSIADAKTGQQQLRKTAEALEAECEAQKQQIAQETARLQAERTKRQTLSEQISSLQISISSGKQEQSYLEETIRRLEAECERLGGERERICREQMECREEANAKTESLSLCREKAEQNEMQMHSCRERLDACAARQKNCTQIQRELFQKQEQSAGRMRVLEREEMVLSGQKEKMEERLNRQTDFVWNEYGLTFGEARTLRGDSRESMSALKQRSGELKQQIRALGAVNVNAVEEFRKQDERWHFLSGQYEDLTRGEEALKQILVHLEEGMRAQFREKFQEIQREFQAVFRELFGGGDASLVLTEGDVIEAGIQIHAQPPGKKLQHILQLSGGEKALTAIALLFAIQNLKPSPFCLLDEIEAALDDSNVDRFAEYLHKLSKEIQFIIITHRRGTMRAADRLYGITMQEKGVSALVSVSLAEGSKAIPSLDNSAFLI